MIDQTTPIRPIVHTGSDVLPKAYTPDETPGPIIARIRSTRNKALPVLVGGDNERVTPPAGFGLDEVAIIPIVRRRFGWVPRTPLPLADELTPFTVAEEGMICYWWIDTAVPPPLSAPANEDMVGFSVTDEPAALPSRIRSTRTKAFPTPAVPWNDELHGYTVSDEPVAAPARIRLSRTKVPFFPWVDELTIAGLTDEPAPRLLRRRPVRYTLFFPDDFLAVTVIAVYAPPWVIDRLSPAIQPVAAGIAAIYPIDARTSPIP